VTGLAANLVAFAKLRHRPHSASLIRDEANPLVHCAALSPRHRLILPADRELSPIHPVYFVTYLSGLDKKAPLPQAGFSLFLALHQRSEIFKPPFGLTTFSDTAA
ncbi:hypothetical protein ABIB00_008010, partial [Bradyrhizobium sp. LB14.3]|uniref:hypothetical protein n=1 Tax=Bradyrhizobium sp. LB14.3 TaxID=3156328 RepID=UPI003394DBE7